MKDIAILDKLTGSSSRITIVVHTHPDGDALGSGAAMLSYLTGVKGKDTVLIVPDSIPDSISFITKGIGTGKLIAFDENGEEARKRIEESDLIICQDCNSFSRTADMEGLLRGSGAHKILIDHHLNPEAESFDLVFSKTGISSASELLFWILMEMPDIAGNASALPADCATALLTGMTTDTNNFANSVFPSTLEMASKLIEAGVNRDAILSELYNNYRENRLRLMGFLMSERLKITGYGVAYIILDELMAHHSVDIQWGNHDILWMGALAGNRACQCNVIRLSLRYANLTTLEEGYGINLVPLATFAMETYGDDPCKEFQPKIASADSARIDQKTSRLTALMHKAITILQFKEEAAIIKRNPGWKMNGRLLFNNIDYDKGTIIVDGKEYELKSNSFPTIDPKHPDRLTPEEQQLMDKLNHSFQVSEKLHKHIRLLLQHGCMYAIFNNNLLFHAAIPLNDDGSLKEVEIAPGYKFAGKELLYNIGMMIRTAFQADTTKEERDYTIDYFLYLWCGPDSPLFDKSKMATFERYFIADKATHNEEKGNYFKLRDNEQIVDNIMDAFEVKGENRHIINGHVPVHVCNGENPIKANGKLMVIG